MSVNIKNIPNANSETYTPTSRATLDMGYNNTYRYVNTNSVPNTNSATYTPTWNGTHDLGATNTYRYVNTTSIYNAASAFSVQKGSFSVSSGNSSINKTISSVDTGKTLVVAYGRYPSVTNNSDSSALGIAAVLTSSTNITFYYNAFWSADIDYFVITFNNLKVQRGNFSFNSTTGSQTIWYDSITTSKAFPILGVYSAWVNNKDSCTPNVTIGQLGSTSAMIYWSVYPSNGGVISWQIVSC